MATACHSQRGQSLYSTFDFTDRATPIVLKRHIAHPKRNHQDVHGHAVETIESRMRDFDVVLHFAFTLSAPSLGGRGRSDDFRASRTVHRAPCRASSNASLRSRTAHSIYPQLSRRRWDATRCLEWHRCGLCAPSHFPALSAVHVRDTSGELLASPLH